MPLTLSVSAILEKNSLTDTGAWLIFIKLTMTDGTIVRLVSNNADVTWDGYTWTAFPFDLEDATEEGGEPSLLRLKVGNATRVLVPYLESYSGLVGSAVNLYICHSDHLGLDAEISEEFEITKSGWDATWVTFTLAAPSLMRVVFPADTYIKNWCRFQFNYPAGTDLRCGYSGATPFTTCDKTLSACRARGNSIRFGGFPGIPEGGAYAST